MCSIRYIRYIEVAGHDLSGKESDKVVTLVVYIQDILPKTSTKFREILLTHSFSLKLGSRITPRMLNFSWNKNMAV